MRLSGAAVPVFLLAVLTSCTSSGTPAPRPPAREEARPLDLPGEELAYLVEPLAGYAGSIDPGVRDAIAAAHRQLLRAGDVDGAAQVAADLLAADPGLLPAQVLAAQSEFARGDHAAVVRRLVPVGDAKPDYTASQLVLGRSAEAGGDVPLAYAAFRAVAAKSPLAFARAGELHPRALDVVGRRLRDELARGRVDAARQQLDLLQGWAPSETATMEAAAAVARASSDRAAELAAIKGLAERRANDRALLERQAELEMEVGDPSAGLQIVQTLAERHPADPALAAKLEATKFRWRLSFLPQQVREVAAKPALDRADLAVLLYWLVPNVRYARPTAGRIATDVLDHPWQEEIVRVVNLGLMDVDPDLHRFSPGATARQSTALASLLRVLSRYGRPPGCGGEAGGVCAGAARCGLVPSADDCLPRETVSGSQAVEMIRLALEHLGTP